MLVLGEVISSPTTSLPTTFCIANSVEGLFLFHAAPIISGLKFVTSGAILKIAEKVAAIKERVRNQSGEAQPLRARVIAPRDRSAPCMYQGDPTGEALPCPPCGGGVSLKVLSCLVHGKCTVKKKVEGIASCAICGDYAPESPKPHPNIALSKSFAASIPPYPPGKYAGRGVVIVGGGKYWPSTYVTVRMLRHVGCALPVQVWYLGEPEQDDRYNALLAPFGVEVVDATTHPAAAMSRGLTGFPGMAPFGAKSFAVLNSPFEEVLSIDADNYPCVDPTVLFDCPRYKLTGGIYWPDMPATDKWTKWDQFGVEKFGPACGWEVGAYVLDKRLAWRQLNLARWYDDHGDWCYGGGVTFEHGDKNARVAWAAFRTEPAFYVTRCVWNSIAFVHPGADGKTPMWIHRCRSKFALARTTFVSTPQNGTNIRAGLPMEAEAFAYLAELSRALS